ncbi:hypothetical protein AB0C01_25400 [Micromonospora sp. NPDC048905]|uniref:DUF7507 domain-containing protein n=1 Tax=Micromonospora sp. NPDC048905 TaxID=3155494 RepID=UPI0033E9DED5
MITSVGQQVPYSFHVVNTGGVPLTNISVSDTQTPPSSNGNLGPISCAATTLVPGARTACTATYTVTQADLDNNGVTNVATAQGTPPGGSPVVSEPETLTIPAQGLTAAVTVVKSSTTASIGSVGQQVPYRYLVANTGGVTLTNIGITDVQAPPSSNANLGPITCPLTTLTPGQTTTCTATYTVTQADLDNNRVTDTATAQGTPPSGTPVTSPPSTLTIPEAGLTPSITVTKTSTTASITTVGQQVPYSFHVVNTGGLTLTNINVTDVQAPPSSNANLGPITCPVTTLAPGARTGCTATYTVTQADLDNDGVTNTAVAHGTPPGGGTPVDSPPSTLTLPETGLVASIAVVKTSTTTTITTIGQRVPYSFHVVNTGGYTLTNVGVTDVQTPPSSNANLGPITCAATTLAPGARTACTATYLVTQADLDAGSVRDTATAHGTPPGGRPPVQSPPSTLVIPTGEVAPAIAIVKFSTTEAIRSVGQQVPYQFLVANTGGLTLNNVNVTDVQDPPSSNANLGPITCPQTTLGPGQTTTCTATYTVTQADLDHDEVTDIATAHGTPPGTEEPVDSDQSVLTIPAADVTPSIAVVKSSTTTSITTVGQQVPYQFLVINNGNLTLTNVNVTDAQTPPSSNANLGPITCPQTTLAPGAVTACTATYTVTQADLDNNTVVDVATAHGNPPGSDTPIDSPPSTLTIPETGLVAAISVVKVSETVMIGAVGQQVPYRFHVVNTGGLTLTTVNVTDVQAPPSSNANLGPITCATTTLAPGEATGCTATYTVTQADLDNGGVTDTATAHGTPPGAAPVNSPPSTLTIPEAGLTADIEVIKSSTTVAITAPGQQVPFTFLVVNTGGLTLTGVTVNDTVLPPSVGNGLGPITCGPQNTPNGEVTLAPGADIQCRATYTVTAEDFAGTALINVATATGTPPSGTPPVSPPSSLDIPIPHPEIAITKAVTPSVVSAAGDTVTYQFVVTNTGNTSLSAVTVDETEFSGTGTPGAITCGTPPVASGDVTLPAGGSTTCTSTYTVTAADIEAGRITNTAVAAGTPPTIPGQQPPGPVRSQPATAEVTATRGAAIAVVKSSSTDKIGRPGQQVPFQFVVTNTGQVALTDVTVTDTLTAPAAPTNLGAITCGPDRTPNGAVTLAAGAAVTCSATYTVSKADYHHGSVRNTATVTGTPPDGPAPVSPESTITIPVKGKLPVTGESFPIGGWMTAGLLAVLLGATLLLIVRQRRARA